ncbi:MAG: hypothetical protein RIC35_04300 [Marinoscillum sp.]
MLSQDLIDNQQAVTDSLESQGSNILTDEEVYLLQAKINELKLQRPV